jgi:hypothetical protein
MVWDGGRKEPEDRKAPAKDSLGFQKEGQRESMLQKK